MKLTQRNIRVVAAVLGSCLLVFAVVGCSSRARSSQAPPGLLDFTFVNNTGLTIKTLYLSPRDVGDWQENILGGDTIRAHERIVIKFNRQDERRFWDLKLEEKNGRNVEFKNLDLRRISRFTLRMRNGVAVAEAE